jgi:hypothetical protein
MFNVQLVGLFMLRLYVYLLMRAVTRHDDNALYLLRAVYMLRGYRILGNMCKVAHLLYLATMRYGLHT